MTISKNLDGSLHPFEIDTSDDPITNARPYPVLAVRCASLPDELLSSWLIRLAWLNAEKLHTFKRRFWNHTGSPWTRNLDLSVSEETLAHIALMSDVQASLLFPLTLRAFAGSLFESVDQHGGAQGLLCEARTGQRVQGYGLQFCPACLQSDKVPYFRRGWRIAYLVVCPVHQVLFQDACPQCHRPITYHLAEFGAASLPQRVPTSFCGYCGLDWRSSAIGERVELDDSFLEWQIKLSQALNTGWIDYSGNGSPIFALSYFSGLRSVLRLLSSASQRSLKLRQLVAKELGMLPLETPGLGRKNLVGRVRLGDRLFLLRQACWLLENWPHRFSAVLREAGLAYSYIDQYRHGVSLPYWIASVATEARDERHAPISAGERESARHFLLARGLPVSANEVGRLLGRWYVK